MGCAVCSGSSEPPSVNLSQENGNVKDPGKKNPTVFNS
jgi:hypothetical protein